MNDNDVLYKDSWKDCDASNVGKKKKKAEDETFDFILILTAHYGFNIIRDES